MRYCSAVFVRALALAITLAAVPACGPSASPTAALSEALARGGETRDPRLTPGHYCTRQDPDFDEYRYAERIAHCRRDVSREEKVAVAATYGVSETELSGYQIDHFIPLSLGGSNAAKNLWPLIYDEARRKAKVEQQLYLAVSRGEMTRAEAVEEIFAWR